MSISLPSTKGRLATSISLKAFLDIENDSLNSLARLAQLIGVNAVKDKMDKSIASIGGAQKFNREQKP